MFWINGWSKGSITCSRRALWLAGAAAFGGCLIVWALTASAEEGTVTISMQDCQATRPKQLAGFADILAMAFSGGRPTEPLVKKGTLELGKESFDFYLPKAEKYTLENTGRDGFSENTSTALSIDDNGNGFLNDSERWFASLPIRVGERMFDIVRIAPDGGSIDLRPSSGPLRGCLVGRKCPPFKLEDDAGRTLTNKDFEGRSLVFDIWSVT